MKKHVIFIVTIILFLIGYTYLQPTSEILTCDASYKCTLTKELAGFIKTSSEFTVDKNTVIEYKKNDSFNVLNNNITAGPVYKLSNGKVIKPFREYTIDDLKDTIDDDILASSTDFNVYLKEPSAGYNIQSYADKFDYITWLIYWILFIFAIIYFAKFSRKIKSKETENNAEETSNEQENTVE
ncbi:MAG: hypothetical protein VZR09_01200 [Candidatus Gastranaerophilaceae bacterium]|nr:hypothetical protein [Candidatus Gastranaerophilaceae bacterium]